MTMNVSVVGVKTIAQFILHADFTLIFLAFQCILSLQ
jgi:hypothetical protein